MEPEKHGLYGLPIPERGVRFGDFWSRSYIIDYLWFVVLVAVVVPLWQFVWPAPMFFFLNDESISWPTRAAIFPQWIVILLAIIPVPVFILLLQIWFRNLHDVHHALLGFFQAIAFTALVHAVFWVSLGKPRPNFLSVCHGVANGVCSNAGDRSLIDERHDFPSGHDAFLVCAGVYLMLYVWGKFTPFRTAGFFHTFLLPVALVLFGTCVGLTRVADGHHSGWGVLAGNVIGPLAALLGYHMQYPAL